MNQPNLPAESMLPQDAWPEVYRNSVVWDAHACLPLMANGDMSPLERHRVAGTTYVSVNVGMDFNPLGQCIRVIAGFRDWIGRHGDGYLLARTIEDVARAKLEGRLAVSFDLEGSMMIEDDLAMLALFRDLGVRQMHLAYNLDNSVAGGCHGAGGGLTELGRAVVREINRVGMIMDCSHSSRQTSLEVMAVSSKPVVFSHSNALALCGHPRNIDDTQIKGCAATGGVVAINGIGPFLGRDIATETMIAHIDHVVAKIGIKHVALGIDYTFDPDHSDLPPHEDPLKWWPRVAGFDFSGVRFVPPERLPSIAVGLLRHGYCESDVAAILGGNFLRVARDSWTQDS